MNDIVAYLEEIIKGEDLQADADALVLIARQSTGCMRDAISLLDQLSSSGEKITLPMAQNVLGTATHQSVFELVNAILDGNTAAGLNSIHQALDGGSDPRQFARQVVEYLRSIMLVQMGSAEQVDSTAEQRVQMANHANRFERARLLNTLRLFNNAVTENRGTWQPSLLLELAMAEAIEQPALPPAATAVFETQPSAVNPGSKAVPPVVKQQIEPASRPIQQTPAQAPGTTPAQAPSVSKNTAPALDDVIHAWPQIRAALKKRSPQTEALLNSCKPQAIKEGALVLGFPSDVLKSKMESNDHKDLTSQVISQVMGIHLSVVCTVSGSKAPVDPGDLGIEGGGLVSTALGLGGKIVTKKKSSTS